MGRPKLTIRETKIANRVIQRKKLLKRASVIGFTRPEGFGHFDDEVVAEEKKVEKKAAKKVEKKEEESE